MGSEAVQFLQSIYPEVDYTKRGFRLNYENRLPENVIRDVCRWNLEQFGDSDET